MHARVPYTDVPYEVYNLETGGPRPRALLDERSKSVHFKVKIIQGYFHFQFKNRKSDIGGFE